MNLIEIENRSGKLKLHEIVMQPVMERLIEEIGKIFGATAFEEGRITGEITNCIENAADTLDIEIHSPGGSVLDGYMLYNEIMSLRQRGVYVTATINSLAASMASVIAMAADSIRMVPQGRMMIHDAQTGVRGNAEELQKWANELEKTSDQIAAIYAERTGGDKDEIRALMKTETWFTAPEAKAKGFIDEIVAIKFDTKQKGMTGILSKLFPGNDEVSKLEASLAESETLRTELENAQAKIIELTGLAEVNAQLQSDLSSVQNKVVLLESKASADAEKIVALESAAEVTNEKVSIRAAELLAAQGHPNPVNLNDEKDGSNTLTRSAFLALSSKSRNEFIRNGGKLID
jgi:ATP-dependent Clp endopeptidase proteolytic subunit ClpP